MDILSDVGTAALAAAELEADPTSLGAAGRMRKQFSPELASAALSQVTLRRKAAKKFSRSDDMFFTSAGLEQATREPVSAWRARAFRDAGVSTVYDLGCGIGADAMAFLDAGIDVHGVEADPDTAALASANLGLLGGRPVEIANAQDIAVPQFAGVFLDPARRTGSGRTWEVADFSPPWSLVLKHLSGASFCCVKMGPGLPKEMIPDGVRATWVSHHGNVVEASLWNGAGPSRAAVVFPRDGGEPVELTAASPRDLEVRPPGRFIIEPDNAVIRAALVTEIAPEADLWLVHEQIAYLSSDEPLSTPLADCFQVTAVLRYDNSAMRSHIRENGIGVLEIKCRGMDVDPAALRRTLKPKGPSSATLILLRTTHGALAVFTRRPVSA